MQSCQKQTAVSHQTKHVSRFTNGRSSLIVFHQLNYLQKMMKEKRIIKLVADTAAFIKNAQMQVIWVNLDCFGALCCTVLSSSLSLQL